MAGARVAEPPHGALERGAEPRAGAHRRRPLRPANLGDSRVDHLETFGAGAASTGELGAKRMEERRLLVGAAAEGVQLGGALSLEQGLQFDPHCALVLELADQGAQAANVMIDTFAIYSTAWSAAEVANRTSYCAERNGLDLYALWSGPSGEDLSGHGWTAEVTSAAAGDCPYVDGEAGACVATAVDACA